jgi:hypothetical protein
VDYPKIKEYIYGNIGTLFWSSYLLIGGGMFVAYYAHIGYMPDFDLKSSVTVLSAAAITAIFTVLLLLLILIIPGAFWGNTWANNSRLKHLWESEDSGKELIGVARWFAAPIGYFYGLLFITFLNWLYVFPYIILGITYLWLSLKSQNQLTLKDLSKELGGFLFTTLTSSFLAFLPVFLIVTLIFSTPGTTKGSSLSEGIATGLMVLFVNLLAAVKPRNIKATIYYLGLGSAVLFFLLISFEVMHRIPTRVMEVYKFGNIKSESIILKESACNTIELLGLEPPEIKSKQCVLEEALILSRLGTAFYIRKNGLEFTIKSDQIISWSVSNSSNKSSKKDAQKTRAL